MPAHPIPALQAVVPLLDSASTVDDRAFQDLCLLAHSLCIFRRFLELLCDLGLPILHRASSSH